MQPLELLPARPAPPPVGLPPRLRAALAARGTSPEPGPGEDPGRHGRQLETALMALFRDTRQDAAFELLYRRSHASLLAWIAHLLAARGQVTDPAEHLQDTFVNVYRYAGSFRDGAGNTFRGWARTIAANVVRRARARRALSLSALPGVGLEPADERGGPDTQAIAGEQRDGLRRAWTLLLLHYAQAFSRLSPRDREALRLVEVQGESYARAGRILGVRSSNMKMIMFRSRKRIRAHMLAAMVGEGSRVGWGSGSSGIRSLRAVG